MRYGDRIETVSPQRRAEKYWQHLARQRFSARDAAYRFFAADVFHDGGIKILRVNVEKRSVVLKLRNVYAVDELWRHCQQKGMSHSDLKARVNRRDFETRVTFHGVSQFKYSLPIQLRNPCYQCAELSREGSGYHLEIMIKSAAMAATKAGNMRIKFHKVEVEDIVPRLLKYTAGHRIPNLLTWISRPAEYYLRRFFGTGSARSHRNS